jgi:hypothetical protein
MLGDAHLPHELRHLPQEIRRLPGKMLRHLQNLGHVTLLSKLKLEANAFYNNCD